MAEEEGDHGEDGRDHDHLSNERKVTRPLVLALAITGGFALFELVGGLLSGSLGLVSDSGHMFTDALALALSLGAAIIATREPTERHTFGFLRVEIVVALINGIALIAVSAFILYESYQRMQQPHPIDAPLMLTVAVIGLIANMFGVIVLREGSHRNLNIKGAFLHVMGDLLSSVGVIVAAVLIFLFDWKIADPIISAVIGVVIMYSAIGVIRQSLNVLLEFAPAHLEVEDIRKELLGVPGVVEVHDIHMWSLTSGVYSMSGHIVVEDQTLSSCSCIVSQCEDVLRERFKFSHTTLQLESTRCEVKACYFKNKNGTNTADTGSEAEEK
jgi:cobalt-zinc-cadmium efflux system protein